MANHRASRDDRPSMTPTTYTPLPSFASATGFPWQTVIAQPSQLGESPFWHPDELMLYWLDIPARQLCRANVFMATSERWDLPQDPGCVAPVAGGGLLIALRDGVYLAPCWGGPLERLASALHDTTTTRFNDGKCDAQGRLWVGTYYGPRDAAKAALYRLDGRSLTPMLDDCEVANGLAWSPDGTRMYWSDTGRHRIQSWPCDGQGTLVGGPEPFARFAPKPTGWQAADQAVWLPGDAAEPGYAGRPDGAAMDQQGNYYCAMFEGQRVLKMSPQGAVLASYPTPARCPTMVCFGGDDLRTLYLTTARRDRPPSELAALPLLGAVFSMRVDVPGLPVNFYRRP